MQMQQILKIYLPFFLLFLSSNALFTQETKYHDYSVNAGFSLGYDFNSSYFLTLPGCVTCYKYDSVSFDKASGLGYSIWAGLNKKLPNILKSSETRMTLNVNYTNFSANYAQSTVIGNFIDGDKIDEIWSETTLNTNIHTVLLHSILAINPFKIKYPNPIFLGLGFKTGLLLSGNFDKMEQLLSPDAAYFENGTKTRAQYDGNIQDLSPFFFALSANASINLLNLGHFNLSSEISFDYALTNFVRFQDNSEYWKASALNLGLNLAYNIPKSAPVMPAPPVIPQLPKLPLPEVGALNLIVDIADEKNQKLQNNENIFIKVDLIETIHTENYLPIIFFELNSDKIKDGNSRELIKYLSNQDKININIGLAFHEDEKLAESRQLAVINWLSANNIATENISFTHQKADKKQRYSQIEEEKAFAQFLKNGKIIQIINEKKDTVIEKIDSKQLIVNSQVTATAIPYVYSSELKINEEQKATSSDEKSVFDINKDVLDWQSNLDNKKIILNCKLIDAEQKQANQIFNFTVIPQITIKKFINSNQSNYYVNEYVIGFFNFDEANIFAVDTNAINAVIESLRQGSDVELIGYTDNLGTNQYNSNLSIERAKSALELINYEKKFINQIEISLPKDNRVNNTSAYTRTQNRTVVARILNKASLK